MLTALTEHANRARVDARSQPVQVPGPVPAPPPSPGRPGAGGPGDNGRQAPVVPAAAPASTGPGRRVPATGVGGSPRPAYGGATTAGGLTRRVRGAQIPASDPLLVSRGPTRIVGGDGDEDGEQSGPTQDVYSFLSGFTAGVQRGLDEAREGADNPEPWS